MRVAQRRDRFLAAGLELFGTRGYQSTSVRAVCREAGLS
ncbi:MAG: TetR family transcriptional regulator, partial [Gordonia sp. (in: high G+C Gram-positive bacteria)]